ncbi:penicillin-binding protein [Marinilactibacillus sp. 15R]|uniref:penicillin-binding transpeptidase domain-containing protein n=1 Tax=Marinilactibacillus sp. 15R TaxID=1911586 RepID=UPI00090C2744|nr:penicillin-binding transpeptidase domain-containing protein [Marinilactibacillus sp. 15R]API89147.1 penicillin-binding protein [Marinilactibacillus sp. 15R]
MKKITKKIRATNPFRNRKIIAVFLYLACFIMFGFVALRFSWIMVKGEINGEDLLQNIDNLYTRNTVLQANRGTIYDKNGNPIAMDASSYKLVAILTDEWSSPTRPQHVQEPEKVAKVLTKYISMSEEEVLEKLTKNSSQVEFGAAGNNLSYDIVSQIQEELEKENLTGITFQDKKTRLYPNGTFASHTIGLAQVQSDDESDEAYQQLKGIMGLEQTYDDILKGTNGTIEYQKDPYGYVVPGEEEIREEAVDGSDLYLTLDRRLQVLLENVMEEVDEEHTPENMTATLMNAKTGEILATSQRPSFNATTKEGIDQSWQNLLVEYAFEPGSTMKVMTLAASIQEGTFHPDSYYMSGEISVAGGTVHDFNPDGWGSITYLEGLARSSNVAFVHQVEEMGYDTWKKYLDNYGFGEAVGMNLPNEYSGSNKYEWPLEKVNTAFGQGLSVTPVQMLRAFSAIANEGNMVKPYLVDHITNKTTNEVTQFEPEYTESLISKETAQKTLQYLTETVNNEHGTAKGYKIDGYEIAAKTGTAQLYNPDTKQYYSGGGNYIYSVVGMAPADDPDVILYVTVQQPDFNGASQGSEVVQKIFNPVMKRALEYMDAEDGDSTEIVQNEMMPNLIDSNTSEAVTEIQSKSLSTSIIGTGDKIVQQFPLEGSTLYDGQKTILLTNGAMTLPDMSGWSRSDAMKVSEMTGVEFEFEGEGYVSEQELAPNSFIEPGTKVKLSLSPVSGEEE